MQIISLRESSKGPGGEYVLIEWRGVPDVNPNETSQMHTVIYYLSTKTLSVTTLKKEEIEKLYAFLRRKEDKVVLMQASKCMM
jgi:hypothetical protein